MAIKSSDQITIVDLTDGCSVALTTDAFSLLGTNSGTVATATNLTTVVQAYRGSTALTASEVTIGTITSITGVTASANGLTITLSVGTTCTGGTISVPITIGSGNDALEFTKTISISVAKTGATGAGAYHYAINVSQGAVIRAEDGTLTPSSITFSATRAQGTGSPAAYSGRFKIEYSANGSSWTAGYTSSSNEASKAYSLSTTTHATAMFIRCTLYLAGGTSTVLAIATVPIVSDGSTGEQGATGAAGKSVSSITAHYLATSASSGVTTSTSGWTTEIQTLTSTNKYLWYYDTITYTNPSSTSNTTPIIIGTYGPKGDQGDQGDPGNDAILLTIESSAGTIFKNSSGSTTLTARVFVGGVEKSISSNGVVTDSLGSIFWYKDGTKVTPASKTLAVSAADVATKMVITAQLEQ